MLTNHKLINCALLLVATLLSACKKDSAAPETSEIRLFTNKSEITDGAIKAKFLSQARVVAVFQTQPTTGTGKITFITPDVTTFDTSTLRFEAIEKAGQYLFYSSPFVQLNTAYDMLVYDMLKYVAPKTPVLCGNGSLNTCYATREVRVGYGDAKQVQLACLQYYWVNAYGQSSGLLYNELNEGIVAQITSSDTLAIRVSRVNFLIQ